MPLQCGQGFEDGGELRGPVGLAEFFIADAFAGGGGAAVIDRCDKWGVGADGFGDVGAAAGVVVDGVVEAGEVVRSDVEEGAGGVVAVDEVDEGFGGAERAQVTGPGRVDKAGAAGSVDAAEADDRTAGVEGELFGGQDNITGGRAAGRGGFVDQGAIVLRVDGGAAGEDSEFRGEDFEEVAQRVVINNAVGGGIATVLAAQAVDEDIGVFATGEAGAKFCGIGGVGGEDAVGFVCQAPGGLFRGNERGDLGTGGGKKIRASFTGVTTAGEEDARN